jgi:hypothetical protein
MRAVPDSRPAAVRRTIAPLSAPAVTGLEVTGS